MTEYCPVCGGRLDKKYQTVLSDGAICLRCTAICQSSRFAALAAVKSAWEENHRRCREFKQNAVVTSMGSSYIHIDTFHQWAYLSSKKVPAAEPIVFAFSELEAYRIERKGEKIVTESKGGIGRAVVGGAMFGPAGAVVGASTAKRETTTTGGISILYVDLNLNGLKTTITLSNPPLETRSTLDSMLNAQKSCVPTAEETDKEMREEYDIPVKNNAPPVTQPTQQPPRKRTNSLGITGFVLAVMALLMSWIPVLNVILSLPAVVFSGVGLLLSGKKNAGKGLSISGLAIGVVALFISVPYSVHVFAAYSPTDSPAKSTVTATLPPEANPTAETPPEPDAEPETESETESEDAPTLGEKNALAKAKTYLSITAFSYSGLIRQLEFDGYTTEEATYGADHCGADWNEQAAKKAKEYLNITSFSRAGLITQLEYEGFTSEQAEYGVTAVGY